MLGDNLQRARKEKGMSQEELALKANVVRQTISKRIGIALSAATLIIMIGVLYFNLELLTLVSTRNIKLRTLRIYTVFNLFVLIVSFGFIFMNQKGSIDFRKEKLFGIFIVIALMLVTGLMADRLPSNRHTGLRLPWLVSDEGSWNLAHRILKIITVPMILLYITEIVLGFESEALSVFIVLMWIRIPSVLSFIYFCRKVRFEK